MTRAELETTQCRFIINHNVEVFTCFLDKVFQSKSCYKATTLEELRRIKPVIGSEMGVLLVPIGKDMPVDGIEAEVNRLRNSGAHVSVLGIAKTCDTARKIKGGSIFDSIVSIRWAAAPQLIHGFIGYQQSELQNRAFRAYLDGSEDGYWLWSVGKDEIEWSKRTGEMTQTNFSSFPQNMSVFSEMIHPHDRDRVEQAIRRHLESDVPYKDVEMRIRRDDGNYGYFQANGRSLRDENGKPILLVGSLTDFTLLQSVEQKLENTQKRFTVLFHQMNDAAVLADIDTGLILEANQPAERLWGRSISELVGMHQSQLHPADLSDEARKAFSDHIEALMKNKRDSIHVPILRSDGVEVPTEISSSLIDIDNKTMILGVFRDISERVKAEREIRERDAQIRMSAHLASMGTLAAGVAHEINTPLAYLLGNLEVLKAQLNEGNQLSRDIIEPLEGAMTGCQYVREIVSDLRSISKMESNEEHCCPSEVVNIATRMAMADLRHVAQVDLKLAKTSKAKISGARLSQVVLNILSNAKRAFSERDRGTNLVTVEVQERNNRIWIVIEDNGSGISSEDLRRIWEPFFTKNVDQGGTGLGLAVCRRVLGEAKGSIWVDSELDRGTQVKISLPVSDAVEELEPNSFETAPPLQDRRLRLLVVDDEPLLTSLIKRMMISSFDVTTFNSALEALDFIRDGNQFDIILCDIMMPRMNGPEFFDSVSDNSNFIFMSGGALTELGIEFEHRMLSEGRLISKPFSVTGLREKLENFLERKIEPQITQAERSFKIIQPDGIILTELENCMGLEQVQKAYVELYGQIVGFLDSHANFDDLHLSSEVHRLAGTVETFGLLELGKYFRASHAAAKRGDYQLAHSEIEKLTEIIDGFENFVSVYSTRSFTNAMN